MADWWQTESMLGHLNEILAHMNYVRTSSITKKTEICGRLFMALNKTWTAFNDFHQEAGRADIKSLTHLLIEGMSDNYIEEFIACRELQNLVDFEPHIMNHDTLRKKGYRPDREITPHLRKEATEEHRELVKVYRNYKENSLDNTEKRLLLLKKIAQLLYIVRSNIAHGEKTPYGPDFKKAERDENVSNIVISVLLKLLELIFDKPNQKLIVYGTLAPGAPNASVLERLDGLWQNCKIRGEIMCYAGLKYFKWKLNTDEIDAKMFISKSLPDELSNIDRFEGSNYHRILIPAKVEEHWIVANIYEGK